MLKGCPTVLILHMVVAGTLLLLRGQMERDAEVKKDYVL